MLKYVTSLLWLSYVSAMIGPGYDSTSRSPTTCVIKLAEEWLSNNFNNSYLDLTTMNIDNSLDLHALHKLNKIRFTSRTCSWNANGSYTHNQAYVVMSENYEELKHGISAITKDLFWNPSGRFIIILQNLEHEIGRVRKLLNVHNIFDSTLLLFQNDDYAIYMPTSTPKHTCIKQSRLVFVSWCKEYSNKSRLSALQTNTYNIHGCRYQFISHNLWPFVNFEDKKFEGIEQGMLTLFTKYAGIEIKLVYSKQDRFGDIITDFFKDMLRRVERDEFEGAVGGYHVSRAYSGNFSHTYPLLIDKNVYVFSRANTLQWWQALINSSVYTCVMVGVLFIIFCTAATLLSTFPSREGNAIRDILVVLGYILNKTYVKHIHTGLPQRLVALSIFFFALVMPYVLQAYLFSVSNNPVVGYEPKDIHEIKDYELILYPEFIKQDNNDFERHCGSRLDCLLKVKYCSDKKHYTIVSSFNYERYRFKIADKNCEWGIYRLQEPYGILLRTMYLRRGSILRDRFNSFLFRFISGGLINKHVADLDFMDRLRCRCGNRHPQNVPLDLKVFYGAHLTLVVGYILSLFLFFCEIFIGNPKS